MKPRSSTLAMLMGVLLGASVGGIIALVFFRRFKGERRISLMEVPWRELIRLIGPIVFLGRQLLELSKGTESEPDTEL